MNTVYGWLTVSGKLNLNQWRLVFEFFDTPNTDRIFNALVKEKNVDIEKPLFDQLTEDEVDEFLTQAATSSCDFDGELFSESLISLTSEELNFSVEKLDLLRESFDFDFFHEECNKLDALYYINRKSSTPPRFDVVSRKEYEDQAHYLSSISVADSLSECKSMDDIKDYIEKLKASNHATFNNLLKV